MVNITDKSKCCGCNACGDVCIHQAIKFHIDVEGFWYPEVDKDKCTDCGLCEKVCPIINKEDWHESGGFEKPHCYALINKNIEVRFDSTSYKPQNKMFHFCKTFCSKITLVNTIQNVILNPI